MALTLFVGVAMGTAWGSLAKVMPHSRDPYVTELRVLFVLLGGLFGNFLTLHLGWGGAGEYNVINLICITYFNFIKDSFIEIKHFNNHRYASATYLVLF